MSELQALLKRYKKAEDFFETDISNDEKLKYVPALRKIIGEITKEQERLGLDTEGLKQEMIKAGVKV